MLCCTIHPLSYFYPRSPCGERLLQNQHQRKQKDISIHALLAESDNLRVLDGSKSSIISIHALLAESDGVAEGADTGDKVFLSTLSLRRATESQQLSARPTTDFYPRSPCGERHTGGNEKVELNNFYPRSPCGERQPTAARNDKDNIFLSTLSLRRATVKLLLQLMRALLFLSTLSLRRATTLR